MRQTIAHTAAIPSTPISAIITKDLIIDGIEAIEIDDIEIDEIEDINDIEGIEADSREIPVEIGVREDGIDSDMIPAIIARGRASILRCQTRSAGFIAMEGYISDPIPPRSIILPIVQRSEDIFARIMIDIRKIWILILVRINPTLIARPAIA